MRIAFAGSPEFAVPALNALLSAGKEVVAVITQPDKEVGRKKILTPTPVKACALSKGLPVYDFAKIRENCAALREICADIMITCAYGQILTQDVLNCFPRGVWNIHASLLPEFRGASPVQSAVLAGKEYTGVTVMRTELSLDTGDMLLVKRAKVGNSTSGELAKILSGLGAEAAVEAVNLLEGGSVQLLMQDEAKATYCKKITKADCKIDFSLCAKEIVRRIKAFSPEPAAFGFLGGASVNFFNAEVLDGYSGNAGEVIFADRRGIAAGCADGAVLITEIQLAGGKRMKASDAANGRKIKAGDKFD